MSKKKKFYVVWEGSETGIFENWSECKLAVQGYPNAKYKSYKSKDEAIAAYNGGVDILYNQKESKILDPEARKNIIIPSLSVDAACSGNPGIVEYQGVDTATKQVIFRQGPFKKGTNNIGEFLALVHALAYLKEKNNPSLTVYSDSRTAMAWVRNKKLKSTFFSKYPNSMIEKLCDRALDWLAKNKVQNPIKKWDTEKWGEIPADFGRK